MKNQKPQKVGLKLVKHLLSPSEKQQLGLSLAQALGEMRGIEKELDQVKAEYKSKVSSVETRMSGLETSITNGFQMVQRECVVVFHPEKKEKHFFIDGDDVEKAEPVAVETMTNEDYVTELLAAESNFEERAELQIFPTAGDDFGFLIIGKMNKMWYGALRVKIGRKEIKERLDSDQLSFKKRFDCVAKSAKRFSEWLTKELGKEDATGFKNAVAALVESQKEK